MRLNPEHGRSRVRHGSAWVRVPLAFAAAAAVVALVGCSSSKPAYCTDRTNLQNSVKGLTSAGISGLKSQIQQVQSDATTVVNSAKGDFPNQTSAITSSVDTLKNSLAALPSSPSATQIATVTRDAASVVTSVKNFVDASNSKCS
jgi:conjugal transfer/entry exclusion protein